MGGPGVAEHLPDNAADAALGFGPLLGRYPGDVCDGDGDSGNDNTDHPWALCTAGFTQLYYQLACSIVQSATVPYNSLSVTFFGQIGIDTSTTAADAVAKLRQAGDAMLQAVIRHSDHLELSEQFDGTTGYQKSVRNLTWSYAAFRPRSGPVQPRPAENTRFQAARRTAIRRAGMTNRPPPGSHPVFTNGPGTGRRQPGSSLTSTSPAWQTVRRAGPVGAGKSDRVGPAARAPVSTS